MIRAILFDLDGTLVDRTAAHRDYCMDLMNRRPDVFRAESREADLNILLGGPNDNRLSFARRAARVFPALGAPAEIAMEHARRLSAFIRPDPAVLHLLRNLKDRYVLGLLSNGSARLQRAKLDAAGLLGIFGAVVISGEQRAAKPHPELFRRALDRISAAPESTLMVGDDPAVDIAGAVRAGMKACWVSAGRGYPDLLPRPEWTIECVLELPEVLA